MDKVDAATRSRIMARIRGRDTQPELMLRRELWRAGHRYRVHRRDVPGTPDLCSKKLRLAVFVDGCFWHGCPKHYRQPSSRVEYWQGKLERNRRRREDVLAQLQGAGWAALAVWECEVHADVAKAARRVASALGRSRVP